MPKERPLAEALKFLRGNILVLTLTRSLGQFCRSMVFPYASLYILALGGNPAQIGLVNALSPLAGLLVFPIAGYLTDRTGRVKLIGLSGFFSGAIILMYVLAPSWQFIAIARLLQGFMVLQFPPTSALIADSLSPQDRGKGVAAMNTISGAIAIFAPYLAGVLIDAWGEESGIRVLYGVMMVAYLGNAAINWRFLVETSQPSEQKFGLSDLPRAFKDAYSGIPAMLRQLPPSLKALAAVIILGFMSNAVAGAFWVVYAKEQIGLSSSEWGLILLIETAIRSGMYIPAGWIVDRYGRTRCALGALALSLVSIPFFVFSTRWIHVLLIRAAVAVVNAFFVLACSALMADIVPRDIRGRVMAAMGRGSVFIGASSGGTGGPGMGFLVTMPVMGASLLGGYLYAQNPTYPWIFVSLSIVLAIVVSALFIRDPQEAEV
jgi:MFS family permease